MDDGFSEAPSAKEVEYLKRFYQQCEEERLARFRAEERAADLAHIWFDYVVPALIAIGLAASGYQISALVIFKP